MVPAAGDRPRETDLLKLVADLEARCDGLEVERDHLRAGNEQLQAKFVSQEREIERLERLRDAPHEGDLRDEVASQRL